jgi:hypothetical protein
LLKTIKKHNAITKVLNTAVIAQGMSPTDYTQILNNTNNISVEKERQLYTAYETIVGVDLETILVPLNCKTVGIEKLSDLLNPKKIFPNSYSSLTVPVYNTAPGPTNSKTYYPIYNQDGGVNGLISGGDIGSSFEKVYTTTTPTVITVQPTPIPNNPNYSATASGDSSSAYNPDAVTDGLVKSILNIVKR